MTQLRIAMILIVSACDGSSLSRGEQHSAINGDLSACIGHFMSDAHNICAGEVVGKTRGLETDGFVTAPGGPTGDEISSPASDVAIASVEDCESLNEFSLALQGEATALTDCLSKLPPAEVKCSLEDVPCPPTLSDAECAAAIAAAADVCGAL